jgi:hypothetical protein
MIIFGGNPLGADKLVRPRWRASCGVRFRLLFSWRRSSTRAGVYRQKYRSEQWE